jgi:hypothetical protein
MDELKRLLLDRLPLAEAVLWVWSWITSEASLDALFDRYRGRCYEKALSFSVLVHLIADALLHYGGSARQSFEHAREQGDLPASIQAAYRKLGRLPVSVSMAFLSQATAELAALVPPIQAVLLPASLDRLAVVVLDGKAIKGVAKRLGWLRGVRGGVLGGRALVALPLRTGLAVAMHAHPDGDANDVRFVPQLCPVVRQRIAGPRLWLADRQFCTLTHLADFVRDGDHFLLRYHRSVGFHPDPDRPGQTGSDSRGRPYTQAWGWLGSARHRQRRYVRQITLQRPGEEAIVLVTDLLDPAAHPAVDLLDTYLLRWGIERLFHQVTEVFGLQRLIGGTPQATIFQFAFCLVLYNAIQVVRAYAAQAATRPVAAVSAEKLFGDATRQLIAWNEMVPPVETIACFGTRPRRAWLRRRLRALLRATWTERWIKAPPKKYRKPPLKGTQTHCSAFRILQEHKRRLQTAQKSGP